MELKNRLIQIAKAISLSLGDQCEAVVHDKDRRIAFIANGYFRPPGWAGDGGECL